MKKTILINLTLIVGIAFFGCEGDDPTGSNDDDPTGSNGDATQIMFVYADHDNDYWDEEGDSSVNSPNTEIFGVVFGDPLPTFEYFKAGGITFSGSEYSEYLPGYIPFGTKTENESPPITSNYDPLSVEVKTSFGTTTGTISLPDSIDSLTISVEDTLELGEPLTISWPGNADFYQIWLDYEWIEDGDWFYTYIDTLVVGNSVTFPGSIFTHNGEIWYIGAQPMNGPLPEAGATGNMSGDGSGFLYYFIDSDTNSEYNIIVGSGLGYWLAKSSQEKPNKQVTQERIRKQIENKILGNQ